MLIEVACVVLGGTVGAIGNILLSQNKKAKELKKECEVARMRERNILEDEYSIKLEEKDKEILNLKNQLNVVEIEEI